MNTMTMHRINSIELDDVKHEADSLGRPYTLRHMTINFTDYSGNEQKFDITLFGNSSNSLLINDATLRNIENAGGIDFERDGIDQEDNPEDQTEDEYYAELNRGYAQDRI